MDREDNFEVKIEREEASPETYSERYRDSSEEKSSEVADKVQSSVDQNIDTDDSDTIDVQIEVTDDDKSNLTSDSMNVGDENSVEKRHFNFSQLRDKSESDGVVTGRRKRTYDSTAESSSSSVTSKKDRKEGKASKKGKFSFSSFNQLAPGQNPDDVPRNPQKSFRCNICLKSYKHNRSLIEHMRQHTDTALACELCSKTFSQQSLLKQHMKDHYDDRPFPCEICGKRFLKKSHLNSHIRMHTGEKAFQCEVCDKSFTRNHHLNVHMQKQHLSEFERENDMYNDGSYLSHLTALNVDNDSSNSDDGEDTESDSKSTPSSQWKDVASEVMSDIKKLSSNKSLDSSLNDSALENEELDQSPSMPDTPEKPTSIKKKGSRKKNVADIDAYIRKEPIMEMMQSLASSVMSSYANLAKSKPSSEKPKPSVHDLERRPHRCSDCGNSFTTAKNLNEHRIVHSKERPFVCEICSKTFAKNSHLTAHLYVHTRQKSFSCDHCNQSFKTNPQLMEHLRTHSNIPSICKYCNRIFPDQELLINHLESHTGERPYICAICEKSFTKLKNLNEHKKIHIEDKNFVCEICSKGFIKNSYLMAHMVVHRGERPFSCDECGHTFKALKRLNEHKKKHRRREEKSYPCEICTRSFPTYNLMSIHMGIHTGERPWPCDECDKSYKTRRHLLEHKLLHAGQGNFPCTICGRTFSARSQLTVHIRTHTGEKPYECPHCKKTFTRCFGLNQHVMTHTGVRPYTCSLCDERFISKPMLASHMQKAHDAETMDLCRPCKTSFLNKTALAEHKPHCSGKSISVSSGGSYKDVESRSSETPSKENEESYYHTCYICMQTFSQSSELKEHYEKHMTNPPANANFCVCPVCSGFFVDKATLEDHFVKAHYGLRDKDDGSPDAPQDLSAKSTVNTTKDPGQDEEEPGQSKDTDKYHCKQCKCSFSEDFHYQQHMLTHVDYLNFDKTEGKGRTSGGANALSSDDEGMDETISDDLSSDEDRDYSKSYNENSNLSMDNGSDAASSSNHGGMSRDDSMANDSSLLSDREIKKEVADEEEERPRYVPPVSKGNSSRYPRATFDYIGKGDTSSQEEPQALIKPKAKEKNRAEKSVDEESSESKEANSSLPSLCSTCGIAFVSPAHFLEHSKLHPQQKEQPKTTGFECDVCCVQPFETLKRLLEHMKIHLSERPYICQECGKSFKHRQYFENHEKVHWLKKALAYACRACNKRFSTQTELNIHNMSHKVDRPFQCECGKTFKMRKHLMEHKKTHNRERPFICTVCEKAFMKSVHLREHMRSHTGEKPFTCQYCKKSFVRKYLLSHHKCVPGTSSKGSFPCKRCDQTFLSAVTYSQHALDVHGFKTMLCEICVVPFDEDAALQEHILHNHALKQAEQSDKQGEQNHALKPAQPEGTTEDNRAEKSDEFDANIKIKTEPVDSDEEEYSRSHSQDTREMQYVRQFTCGVCDQSFPTRPLLSEHVAERHTGRESMKGENLTKKRARKKTGQMTESNNETEASTAEDLTQKYSRSHSPSREPGSANAFKSEPPSIEDMKKAYYETEPSKPSEFEVENNAGMDLSTGVSKYRSGSSDAEQRSQNYSEPEPFITAEDIPKFGTERGMTMHASSDYSGLDLSRGDRTELPRDEQTIKKRSEMESSRAKFICLVCRADFPLEMELNVHMSIHVNNGEANAAEKEDQGFSVGVGQVFQCFASGQSGGENASGSHMDDSSQHNTAWGFGMNT